MTSVLSILNYGQALLLAASLPLALIALRGYWGAPFGLVVAGLPVVSVGLLLSASGELLSLTPAVGSLTWQVGSVVAVAGFAWVGLQLVRVLGGWTEVGG
ncbi:hypothetical protein HUG10_03790 [Halorarum halophilum]|uniref:Uncharacterized protein n=1 Tax=Halorarum halophilum TaxID=2743090 RepID=A0A7D5KCK4_9EURY|nr:hypothetical protein [Halobaculum halophilum]QLG26717.1 hypothetical protein HUG10_03790 [Halobaculum halophilum]